MHEHVSIHKLQNAKRETTQRQHTATTRRDDDKLNALLLRELELVHVFTSSHARELFLCVCVFADQRRDRARARQHAARSVYDVPPNHAKSALSHFTANPPPFPPREREASSGRRRAII